MICAQFALHINDLRFVDGSGTVLLASAELGDCHTGKPYWQRGHYATFAWLVSMGRGLRR
jgi:hypothetical protein